MHALLCDKCCVLVQVEDEGRGDPTLLGGSRGVFQKGDDVVAQSTLLDCPRHNLYVSNAADARREVTEAAVGSERSR